MQYQQYGTRELGAIGAMAVVINIMQMSIQTINVTNSSLIAKAIGEKDENKIKLISGNSIMLTVIISIITILIALVIKPILPTLFNVDKICNTYLIIRLVGFFSKFYSYCIIWTAKNIRKARKYLKIKNNSCYFKFNFGYCCCKLWIWHKRSSLGNSFFRYINGNIFVYKIKEICNL